MFNLQNKKRSEYIRDGDFDELQEHLRDYWDKSRASESAIITDLEKHLWLANGAAATVTLGYIQARDVVPYCQYLGAWIFVAGIMMLVIMKFVSVFNSSRDRYRFQAAKSRFDADKISDIVFKDIRDKMFYILNKTYNVLQWGAGIAFLVGCVLTLLGVKAAL